MLGRVAQAPSKSTTKARREAKNLKETNLKVHIVQAIILLSLKKVGLKVFVLNLLQLNVITLKAHLNQK